MARPLPESVEHICELFAPLGAIRAKAMFGGWGMNYWTVPGEALESSAEMQPWARLALAAALRARKPGN